MSHWHQVTVRSFQVISETLRLGSRNQAVSHHSSFTEQDTLEI
ncbi:hypothetical protein Cadr_000024902 [Camelus dromedarius]|uniref:Uncharacterized protein n=1 Tax=Camelus dromedarius TaxID=9838 RepID=A0A5N4CNN6_CAMDR|nr:hypothetical protein Cadr_000024902 [Camelus dromedarius]